jgi:hypothetical protein
MSFDLRRLKLGPVTSPNGADGDNDVQTVNNTAHNAGPFEDGWYSLTCTKNTYILQGPEAILAFDASTLIALGVEIPASTEVEFSVNGAGDRYLAWVRVSADGTIRINSRSSTVLPF